MPPLRPSSRSRPSAVSPRARPRTRPWIPSHRRVPADGIIAPAECRSARRTRDRLLPPLVRRAGARGGAPGGLAGRRPGGRRAVRPEGRGAPGRSCSARSASCSRPPAPTPSSWPCWPSASAPARRWSAPRSPSSRPPTPSCAWARARSSPTSRSARSASIPRTSSGASPRAPPRSCRCTTRASPPTWTALLEHRATPRPARRRGRRPGPRRQLPGARRSARSATPAASASTRRRT